MQKVLVITERSASGLDDSAFELIAAARSLGEVSVSAAVLGKAPGSVAEELSHWCDEVHCFSDEGLEIFDGDFQAAVLAPLVSREEPLVTLIAHSNNGMDLAPALAIRTNLPLIADCLALENRADRLSAVRAVYGGKVHARVSAAHSPGGAMATVRPGAFAPPDTAPDCEGTIHEEQIPDGLAPRRRLIETLVPEAGAVDISQAEVLIAVGRGIEDEENLEIAQSLAEALGGELACTRPVVDKKWLGKSHQVGTSGTTVKPRIYVAIGVSGSFQHMGGIKGGPFIAAINKDPAAPIFSVADVGIVGDLFDIVPLLEEKIRERKG